MTNDKVKKIVETIAPVGTHTADVDITALTKHLTAVYQELYFGMPQADVECTDVSIDSEGLCSYTITLRDVPRVIRRYTVKEEPQNETT